jgi:hypothetical protein
MRVVVSRFPAAIVLTSDHRRGRPGRAAERTAVATIKWTAGRAVIEDVVSRADDDAILQVVKQADKTGIDCPLGWPAAFVDFETSHTQATSASPHLDRARAATSTMRRTDAFVHEQLDLTPLSVSADRIAHVALRCAVLLAKGSAVDRPAWRTPGQHAAAGITRSAERLASQVGSVHSPCALARSSGIGVGL